MSDTISTATEMVRVPILGDNGRISDDYVPEAIPQSVEVVKQAAQAAASSANESAQSAAAAEKSASSAASSVEQAKTYANNASTYMATAERHADDAELEATAAAQSAQSAASSAERAEQSVASIGTGVTDAQSAASAAKQSAAQAATSESNAAASATAASGHADDAESSATEAQSSASAAASSASSASESASAAQSSATAAASSASSASSSASEAEQSKNDAQSILNEANAKFIDSATATTLEPGQPATANVVDNVLNLGIPKGDKGDKGDTGTGIPDGGTTGDFVQKTADGTQWFDSEGLVRASYIGTLQKLGDAGQSLEVHDASVTSNGYVAGISVEDPSTDGAYVYADDTNAEHLGHNHVGVDEAGPYVDIAGADAADGKYRYVDIISEADADEIPTAASVKKYVESHATTNTLVGTTPSGEYIAHADDAYAAKPREVRIKGRTVQNLWPVIAGTRDGLTIATDETGLITVSGTATASGHIRAMVSGLAENKNVSAVKSGGTMVVQLQAWNAGAYVRDVMTVNTSASTANTGTGFDTIYARINYTNGETYNASFRIMLVEGTEAPDCFTPTGVHGVEPEKLVVAGKNLLKLRPNLAQSTAYGVTFTPQDDGGILVNGTATDVAYYNLDFDASSISMAPGTDISAFVGSEIVISGDRSNVHISSAFKSIDGAATRPNGTTNGNAAIVPAGAVRARTYMFVNANDTINNVTVYPQLELGSTATAYEPPTVTEVTLPETDALMDGDVMTIAQAGAVSVTRSDGTTDQLGTVQTPQLPAPTFNVYTTGGYVPSDTSVVYEKDVNITINNMQEVIDSLVGGGN